jgi:ribosomal protein L37AE/L43A
MSEESFYLLDVITEMRGESPNDCDYCGQEYNGERTPIPDEGGTWACTECWEKWEPGSIKGASK